MMRNIIAITHAVLADRHLRQFRHRAHPDRRRPLDHTHIFATWAFRVGIEGSDIPLGASVSLFMVPILAVAAIFILRDITKRGNEILMSTMTIDKSGPTRKVKYGSMSRDRTWALRWSYFFLVLFAIFSLTPPLYMLITSLKGSAEISAATNPWWVYHPTLENYVELLTVEPVPALLLEFGLGLDHRRHHHRC